MRFDASMQERGADYAVLAGGGRNYQIQFAGGGIASGPHPVPTGTLWAIHPWGEGLVLLEQTHPPDDNSGTLLLTRIDGDGSIASQTQFAYRPRPLRKETADSIVNQIAANWSRKLSRIGRPVDEAAARNNVEEDLALPKYWPAADRVLLGTDGSVWFRRQGSPADTDIWDVIRPDGTLHGQLRVSSSLLLQQVSMGSIFATSLGQHDIPVVVHFGLR